MISGWRSRMESRLSSHKSLASDHAAALGILTMETMVSGIDLVEYKLNTHGQCTTVREYQ